MGKHNNKRYSKAWAISDRSGFKFPMSEMVDDDGYLVHKSETDGDFSLRKHPLSNMGRYLKGKTGDPFSVPNARPDIDWVQPMVFQGTMHTRGEGSFDTASGLVTSIKRATADWTGSATWGSSAQDVKFGVGAWTSTATWSASGENISFGTGAWTGTATFSADAQDVKFAAGAWTGTATWNANAVGVYKGTSAWTVTATWNASGEDLSYGAADWTGAATWDFAQPDWLLADWNSSDWSTT